MNVRECRCMEIITSTLQCFGSVLVNCQVFEFFGCNFRWKKKKEVMHFPVHGHSLVSK